MEFEIGPGAVVVQQQGETVLFRVHDVSDPTTFVGFKLSTSQAVEIATKLLFEAQKATWHAG